MNQQEESFVSSYLVGFDGVKSATESGYCSDDEVMNRVQLAVELAVRYGGIDGSHHKMWVIDQMVRILAGKDYEDVARRACDGEDGPNTYSWSVGVVP